jgi:hypothetical protein
MRIKIKEFETDPDPDPDSSHWRTYQHRLAYVDRHTFDIRAFRRRVHYM